MSSERAQGGPKRARRERRLFALGLWACAGFLSTCAAFDGRPAQPILAVEKRAADNPADFALRLIGQRRLDHRLSFGGTTVGGLSGIDYDPGGDLYYLISDDRSDFSPARFYTARLKIDEREFSDAALQTVVTLLRPDGTPYPPRGSDDSADGEAIRFDRVTRSLWWTSEGDRALGHRYREPRLVDPFIRQSSLDGRHMGEAPLDPMFRMSAELRGPRSNRVFEGATLSADAQSLWIAMEGSLIQDGPMPTSTLGAWSRFSRHDRTSSKGFGPVALQLAYPIDPVPAEGALTLRHALNGVSEILAIDTKRFLVLERAYILGPGWRIRLYEADASDATDVRSIAALAPMAPPDYRDRDFVPTFIPAFIPAFIPIKKRLVLDFSSLGIEIDNLEGLCFGPVLSNGHRTLVLLSDDNFNPGEVTQFLAFEIVPGPIDASPRSDE